MAAFRIADNLVPILFILKESQTFFSFLMVHKLLTMFSESVYASLLLTAEEKDC